MFVKTFGDYPAIEVIMMSGFATEHEIANQNVKCKGFLKKPFQVEEVRQFLTEKTTEA